PALLVDLALIEALAGRPGDALKTLRRSQDLARAFFHQYPRVRLTRRNLILALSLEYYLHLQAGRPTEAARAADAAATEIEGLPRPLGAVEQFFRGAAHACAFVVGRPAGPGRPAEPPGLRDHSDRAVADVLESARTGFRAPIPTAMVARLLPDRPELRLLLLDLA